jgi:hypothetical protein
MDSGGDIIDPFGRDVVSMRVIMERVHRCTERVAETLVANGASRSG